MFYFLVLLAIFIIAPYAFFSKKLIAGVTKGENYESTSPIGKTRSWIYCISVVISLAIDVFDYGKTWLYSSSTISGLFVPYTYTYQVLYGDDASRDVFLVLAFELLFISALLFCRCLSAGMVCRFIKDGNCTKYKYIKRLMWVLVFAFIFQTAFFFTTAFEASTIERITDIHYDVDSETSFVTYNMIWILAFSGITHTLSQNKMAFGTHTSESKASAPLREKSPVSAKNNRIKVNFNTPQEYRVYRSEQSGVEYWMNQWLYTALVSKSAHDKTDYLGRFELFVAASESYPCLFAHIFMAISLILQYDSWYAVFGSLCAGFVTGTILSLSAGFIIYNIIFNYITVVYNFLKRIFVVDIIFFVVYIFVLNAWWMIFVHIIVFLLLFFVSGFITTKPRSTAINNLALHYLPELKYEQNEKVEETEPENKSDVESNIKARQKSSTSFTDESNIGIQTQSTFNINEYSADETRLAEIEAELKKIPVAKVKQWYADGKLSEEQYKSIARKYNTLKKERADILERMELLRNI